MTHGPVPVAPRAARFRCAALFGAALATLLLTGCAAARLGAAPAGNSELIQFIGEQPFVSRESAHRAAYILWKGQAGPDDYEALHAELASSGLIREGRRPQDAAIDRAEAALLICRAAGIESGINWRITGLGRYAWRELQYLNIAPAGSEWRKPSGGEFLGLLTRAEDYSQSRGKQQRTNVELGKPGELPPRN